MHLMKKDILYFILMEEDFYKKFLARTDKFYESLKTIFEERGLPAFVQHLGAGFHNSPACAVARRGSWIGRG